MKRLFAILLTAALLLSTAVIGVSATTPEPWDGTTDITWYDAADPKTEYTLSTAKQFAGLAELSKTVTFAGVTIKLGADIVLNDVSNFANWGTTAPANEWQPISNVGGVFFQGMLDGQGHTISGMYSSSITTDKRGLIGVLSNTTENFVAGVKNLKLVNSYVKDSATDNVALIVGRLHSPNEGTHNFEFSNIYAKGSVSAGKSATMYVGGICGNITHKGGTITFQNIISDVDVTCTMGDNDKEGYAGGIVGGGLNTFTSNSTLEFKNCINVGDVNYTGTKKNPAVGGMIGLAHSNAASNFTLNIDKCINLGNLTSPKKVGGIICQFTKADCTISNCYNGGTITGTSKGVIVQTGTPTDATNCYSPLDGGTYHKTVSAADINAAFNNALTTAGALTDTTKAASAITNVIKAANAITLENGLFAVQTSTPASNAFNARFLAKVKSCEGKAAVGFTVTINGVSRDYNTPTVYESIIAENDLGLTDVVTVANLNAAGFFAVSVKGLPASGTVTVTISTYSQETVGGDKTVIDNYTVTFTDGAFVSCVPVA